MPQNQHGRIVESTTEARAGVTGHGVRWVLLTGTLAVVAIFALLWFSHFI